MFKDRIVSPHLLRACFRFFPDHGEDLRTLVKKKASDSELLGRIADALKLIDSPESLDLLKKIFEAGDAAVQVKVLQAMQNLMEYDEAFLFPVLEKKNELIQAEALILLMRHERDQARRLHQALRPGLALRHPEQDAPPQPRHRRPLRPARGRPLRRPAGRAEGFLEPQGPAGGRAPHGVMALGGLA